MRLYAANGERARVIKTYQQCAAVLRQELETEPSQATRDLYEQLARETAQLTMPAKPLTNFPSPKRGDGELLLHAQDRVCHRYLCLTLGSSPVDL
jgi:DNA-binding SARP family transcriptional activator